MKITYIHHSSFSAEFDDVTLLFDYFEGVLPELPKDKPLLIFASHFHADHFSPVIFESAKGRSDVYYILSKDIKKQRVPEELLDRVQFVGAGEKLITGTKTAEPGRKGIAWDGVKSRIEIETFLSTDEGVAFWISADGKQLYHAGDLNNWWWEGEDKAWNHNMAANYSREIEKMAGRRADAAFVPLDPRQEAQFYLGMDEFMRTVSVGAVFPMHFWRDYSIIGKMKQHPCSEAYRDKIAEIHEEGEEFVL